MYNWKLKMQPKDLGGFQRIWHVGHRNISDTRNKFKITDRTRRSARQIGMKIYHSPLPFVTPRVILSLRRGLLSLWIWSRSLHIWQVSRSFVRYKVCRTWQSPMSSKLSFPKKPAPIWSDLISKGQTAALFPAQISRDSYECGQLVNT